MGIKNLKLVKAENAVMAHDWKTAARLYKDLLVGDEANEEYLKALANIYVKSGEDEKAIPYFEQIITFHPHDVDSMNSLGAIYRRLGRFEDSITVLQKAKAENKNLGNVNYNLGFTYKEMKNYDDAIDAFETVIAGNPNDVLAYNHLGSIYFATKDYEKSISIFRKGLQIDPNHPILNYNLARCFEAVHNETDAIHCYQAALKTRPGWIDAIRDFSGLLVNCQKTQEAQDIVEQSIKLHPLDTDLLCLLGTIYLEQNDYENSTTAYRKADGIKSGDTKILTGLAKSLEKSNKVEQALGKVEEAVDLDPDNKEIRKQYAHTLLSAQRYDQALDNINGLYNDKGDTDPQVLDLYGQYFICRGNEEIAKKYYDKIKKLNHHYKDYILEATDRFVQIGDYYNAEKYAKDYIAQRPHQASGYTNLGKVYAAQGKLKNAREEFEKSVNLTKPNVFVHKELSRINDEIEQNPDKYRDEDLEPSVDPNKTFKTDAELESEIEENEENPIVEIPEEDNFDFAQMGGDEMEDELLKEEEEDFWNNFDDESGEAQKNELIEDPMVGEPEVPQDVLPDELYPQDPIMPEMEEEPIEEEEADPIEVEAKLPEPPVMMAPPEPSPAPVEEEPLPPLPPEPQYMPKEDLMDRLDSMEEALKEHQAELEDTDKTIKTALNLEQMAKEMEEKQKNFQEELRKENEMMIQETVEKTVDERLQDVVDIKTDDKFPDDEELFEDITAIDDAEDNFDSIDDLLDDFDEEKEELFEDEEVVPEEEASVEEENKDFNEVEIYGAEDELECKDEGELTLPEEDIELLDEETPVVTVVDNDGVQELKVQSALDDDVLQTAIEHLNQDEPINNDEDMLSKIQKILSDPVKEKEHEGEIELFKKLRILSDSLPESEKNSFKTCKMRVLMEYLISKMSGKPGLLLTTESLLKSGVLGPEYESQLFNSDPAPVSDSLVVDVLLTMKELAGGLEDKELFNSLVINIDSLLEKIELHEHGKKIF